MRAFYWAALLPATVTTAWTAVVAVLAGAYGEPSRAALEQRPRVEAAWGRTPIQRGGTAGDGAGRWPHA